MKSLSLFLSLVFLFACAPQEKKQKSTKSSTNFEKNHGQGAVSDTVSQKNILQVAIGSEAHSTLVAGVKAAGLVDVLANAGPFTVFAPTNAAFAKLPEGALDNLLKPENKSKLARLIKFHAAPSVYTRKLLKDGQRLFMASGHYINVERKDGEIYVNGAKIGDPIKTSNGIIYVVDKVFLIPE